MWWLKKCSERNIIIHVPPSTCFLVCPTREGARLLAHAWHRGQTLQTLPKDGYLRKMFDALPFDLKLIYVSQLLPSAKKVTYRDCGCKGGST